jgi:hypothetical protein
MWTWRLYEHVVHLVCPVHPSFYCSQPGHDAGGPPSLHLLFLAHYRRPPVLVHQLLCCLFVARCRQHVVHLIGPICNIPPSNRCNCVLVMVNHGFESNSIRIQFKFSSNSSPKIKSNFI